MLRKFYGGTLVCSTSISSFVSSMKLDDSLSTRGNFFIHAFSIVNYKSNNEVVAIKGE